MGVKEQSLALYRRRDDGTYERLTTGVDVVGNRVFADTTQLGEFTMAGWVDWFLLPWVPQDSTVGW